VIGADIASQTGLRPGASVKLLGKKFAVIRAIAAIRHDRRQAGSSVICTRFKTLARAGQVVSAIEVLGCCEDAAGQPRAAAQANCSRMRKWSRFRRS